MESSSTEGVWRERQNYRVWFREPEVSKIKESTRSTASSQSSTRSPKTWGGSTTRSPKTFSWSMAKLLRRRSTLRGCKSIGRKPTTTASNPRFQRSLRRSSSKSRACLPRCPTNTLNLTASTKMPSVDRSAKSSFTALASNLSAPSSPTPRRRNSSTASPPRSEAEKDRVKCSKDWRAAKTDQESASKIPIASAMISSTPKPAKHSSSPKLAGAPEEGQDPRSLVNNSIGMPSERARGKQ